MKKIVCFIFTGVFLFGADYGRINGNVFDAETGKILAGANLITEGTQYGGATDASGEYTVLFVPPGTYDITASFIGYQTYTYTNVIVNTDQTTKLDFRLPPAVISVEGITAIAERPLITISETSTGRAVTSQEFNRLPLTTINQIINLQPGSAQSEWGTHVRGGRYDEIVYIIDGIVTMIPNRGRQSAEINFSAVEEISITSGGFDAEYGDALSGIINITTKQGGQKYQGGIRFITDGLFSAVDRLDYGYNLVDFSLGGPLPNTQWLRFFISGELMTTDSWENARYKVESPRIDNRTHARLSIHLPKAKGRIHVSLFDERKQMMYWTPYLINEPNTFKYFDKKPMNRIKNRFASATIDYMLTPKTLAALKFGITHHNRALGNRDYEWEETNNRQWFEDYRLTAEHLIEYLLAGNIPIGDILTDSLGQYHTRYESRGVHALRNNPYGIEGIFQTYGDFREWYYWHNSDYQGRVDIAYTIGKIHELKTGMDFTLYDIVHARNTSIPYYYLDYYNAQPYKFACYLLDNLSFRSIIIRAGLRFDYLSPDVFTFAEPNNLLNDSLIYSKPKYSISPRLGFSLPVAEHTKFRFNYGHYRQFPQLQYYYRVTDTSIVRLRPLPGPGNIALQPQKTVMYEMGLEHQFSADIAVGFVAYYKDVYSLTQVQQVPAIPRTYWLYTNVDYANVKGIEINLEKQMSSYWGLGCSYTLQFAKGTGTWAGEASYEHYYQKEVLQAIDYWLDYDERHTVIANIDLSMPEDYTFLPLRNFNSSVVFSYHSGHPYTPLDLRGNRLGDVNSARMPGYWNIDLRFNRALNVGPLTMVFDGIIYNLFNTEQILYVYETTGKPDDHGDPEPNLDQFGYSSMTSEYYSPQADYNHDGLITPVEHKRAYVSATKDYYENPVHYNAPFRMRLGIGLKF